MQRLKAKAALTASLLADDRERHWSRTDAPPPGVISLHRRSPAISTPDSCNKGAASAIGFELSEEALSSLALNHADALYATPPSLESKMATALCSRRKQYKLAIWVSSQQRERIRSLAARHDQTIQGFLLAAIDEQLDRIGGSEEAEIRPLVPCHR